MSKRTQQRPASITSYRRILFAEAMNRAELRLEQVARIANRPFETVVAVATGLRNVPAADTAAVIDALGITEQWAKGPTT